MKPKQARRQKRRIVRIWNRWRPLLGIDEWQTTLTFHEGEYIDQGGNPSTNAIATTLARWQYRTATVAWNLESIVDVTDERLEEHVVHEMMHIVLNEMRERRPRHEERVASTLAFAFLRVGR